MSAVAVVTDSTADLGPLAQEYGIEVVPLSIAFGGERFRDGVDLSMDEFYLRLASGQPAPVTSQPAPAAFEAAYRRLLAGGASGILSLHLSSELSGTCNAAMVAARDVDASRIHVVDTRTVSLGVGMVAMAAAQEARRGARLDELAARATAEAAKVDLYATIPSLTYLARGGRIGPLRGLLGNVLKIVPIITLRDGRVAEYAKVRTFARAVDEIVTRAVEQMRGCAHARCAVLHGAAAHLAEEMAQRIREAVQPSLLLVSGVGPTIGTHAGPGVVGVIFIR